MNNDDDNLYYTYLDECKKNYLTDCMRKINPKYTFEEYSITSITFKKDYYQEIFEQEWADFRDKYDMDGDKAMHFVEYKKLISIDNRKPENIGFSKFVEEGVFSEEKLKSFFKELRELLSKSKFFIVHTDYYWEKNNF